MNRRHAIAALAAGGSDPMLEALLRYRRELDFYNSQRDLTDADSDALAAATWHITEDLITSAPPPFTSMVGLAEGIRRVIDEDNAGEFEGAILTAALAYVEGRAA